MAEGYYPADIPPVYRGGPSLAFRPHEVRIDKLTGVVKPTHGVSVDSSAENVVGFGGAYRVRSIPVELTIIQRGQRPTHYEIVPKDPISPERYQELLDEIELELFLPEE